VQRLLMADYDRLYRNSREYKLVPVEEEIADQSSDGGGPVNRIDHGGTLRPIDSYECKTIELSAGNVIEKSTKSNITGKSGVRVLYAPRPGTSPKGGFKQGKGGKVSARSSGENTGTVFAECPKFPPDLNPVPVRRCRRRWQQNAAVSNVAFTLADGHNQFLVVTNVLGNAVPFVDCWRIRRIMIWCISEGNVATNVTLTPVGADIDSNAFNDRERIFQCSSRSTAEPGAMCIKTSHESPMGAWHFTSNVNAAGALFQMNILVNGGASQARTTIDIEFEYVENFVGLPLGYGVVTATTTLGTVGGRNILTGFTSTGVNNLG